MRPASFPFLPLLLLLLPFAASCAAAPKHFETADAAVADLVAALRAEDIPDLERILGPGSEAVLDSGDDVADRAGRARFVELYDEQHRLVAEADGSFTLCIGALDYPVPIPIVPASGSYRFDIEAGVEEILARRIGRNELSAIEVCRAYVDAQREYAAADRDGDGLLEYARQIRSTPGTRDGLYWEAEADEDQSPLGELMAGAAAEGYDPDRHSTEPSPYHGYVYGVLEAQGEHAPGGAFDYVVRGDMIGGFALVAYPAEYGTSGVMTFVVSHDGAVHQKDLGDDTATVAKRMKRFDPDDTWTVVE